MRGSYLLDTNVVIALFNLETAVQERLAAASGVFVPSIVLGELYFGAARSSKPAENATRIDEFVAGRSVLDCDRSVAREYGWIKNELRAKGRPLPENDIWIAAIARQHGCVLATRDVHFREIRELKLEMW
jgi:tRNA(fMet)-specific endonuclease VapC